MQQGDENDGKLMSESDIRQVRTQQGFSSTEGTEVAVIKEVGTRQGAVLAVYVDVEITQKNRHKRKTTTASIAWRCTVN